MSYSQENKAAPPWSTAANNTANTHPQASYIDSANQQYANYYQQQHYPLQQQQQQSQDQYYQQYYQQQQYAHPPPPGTAAPTAPPGTSEYNYNYNQYYSGGYGYNQQAPAHSQQQQYQQHYQQQPTSYNQQPTLYNQIPQQTRPPPAPQPTNTGLIKAPVAMDKPAATIPPWSRKPVEPLQPYQQPPAPPTQSAPYQPPPPPPAATQSTVASSSAAPNNNVNNAMSSEHWPPSLRQYVQDVFANCLPNQRDKAELQLRNIILEFHNAGTLMSTDWSEMDLPHACKQPKKKKKGKKANNNNLQKNLQAPKKNPPLQRATGEDETKRLQRLRRFQEEHAQFRAENISTPLQAMHLDGSHFNQTVVGTSTKLEKQYLRLTSAPDPATVRPLPILRQTLILLKEKWKKEQNYAYICDQFKSLRQDLTVQRIKNEFTVQVYEIHARIALEKSDLGEYNQCQTQLKGLYNSAIQGHVMEFTAYRILYFLHTQNWADVNATMVELTQEQKKNEFVQHALSVRSSLATSNFHRFFKLYRNAPNMGGYLMDQFIERARVQALIVLCKTCRPDLAIDFVMKELAFGTDEEFNKFLVEQKANTRKANNEQLLDTRLALVGLVESQKKYKKIDIKGQV